MNVGVYNVHNGVYEIVHAFIALDKVIPLFKHDEAKQFLSETGRYWYKENGKPRYLTRIEG